MEREGLAKAMESFRREETKVLCKALGEHHLQGNTLISTGGGVVLGEENRSVLESLSKVVWLK